MNEYMKTWIRKDLKIGIISTSTEKTENCHHYNGNFYSHCETGYLIFKILLFTVIFFLVKIPNFINVEVH